MMKSINILILLPNLCGGGAERLHVHLANYWHEKGIRVNFVLMQSRGELIGVLSDGVGVIDLGVNRIRKAIVPLARHLRKISPDIVIAAMWPLTSVAVFSWWLAGRPGRLYLSDHNQLSISCVRELKISAKALGLAMRLTYPYASGVIAVSEGVKKDMCQLGGFPESLIRVIYNPTAIGVSPHREAVETRQRLWGVGFDHHILSIGTLKSQKDHATLINAFFRLSKTLNAKLTILGEGPLRSELQNLVVKLGLQGRVEMPGFVQDPYPWIRSADLFVLSSQWEGFGNVIVEALECGVPVVSTDCPSGPSEILAGGRYGRLVPVHNSHALADAMGQSLLNPVERNTLMERAKDFTVSVIADQYLSYMSTPQNLVEDIAG